MSSEEIKGRKFWLKRKRGPLRAIVDETPVDGVMHEILECGHLRKAEYAPDGLWSADFRCCKQCLNEIKNGRRKSDFIPPALLVEPRPEHLFGT